MTEIWAWIGVNILVVVWWLDANVRVRDIGLWENLPKIRENHERASLWLTVTIIVDCATAAAYWL